MSYATAGELRNRITVQVPASISDGQGGKTSLTWGTFLVAWAKIEPKTGQARLLAMNAGAVNPSTVTLRWRAGVTAKMRVKLKGGRLLKIISVVNPEELNQWIVLECSEVSA